MSSRLLCVLIMLVLAGAGCSKKITPVNSQPTPGITYKGVVLRNACCQIVVQTLGPNYLGLDTWPDSSQAGYPVYSHVFTVANPCQFGNHAQGDTITFKTTDLQAQTCACCMMFVYTPSLKYPIVVQ